MINLISYFDQEFRTTGLIEWIEGLTGIQEVRFADSMLENKLPYAVISKISEVPSNQNSFKKNVTIEDQLFERKSDRQIVSLQILFVTDDVIENAEYYSQKFRLSMDCSQSIQQLSDIGFYFVSKSGSITLDEKRESKLERREMVELRLSYISIVDSSLLELNLQVPVGGVVC